MPKVFVLTERRYDDAGRMVFDNVFGVTLTQSDAESECGMRCRRELSHRYSHASYDVTSDECKFAYVSQKENLKVYYSCMFKAVDIL